MLVVPSLLTLVLASNAAAATAEGQAEAASAWNSPASIATAAKVIGVSTTQAAEDLALQHEARQTITELMEAGDHVWFDNTTASIHVYGPTTSVAVAPSIAGHIVHDATLHVFPAQNVEATADSCGTSRSSEEYCSPLEAGVKIHHQSGAINSECTAGFMVRPYGNDGVEYMLSAGHCNIWGTTFFENPYTSDTWPGLKGCTMGPWTRGDSPWSGYDASITEITGCEGVIPYIHNWETGVNTHQEGATNSQYVGEYVCHWGITSLHQCGTDVAANVETKINYEDSGSGKWWIKETDQVCGYAAEGDSGGPVTSGVYQGDATGILLGAGPRQSCGGDDTFWVEQRIFAALGLFDVYVASS
ncbi:MAG TPA: hypothetical protein VK790_10030 [Solirubrobacteraceae bacterium]|jgi:hypothetical protein|nr:hypothetical protein [Solirubrobacteraceae bacterium]